jgi:hypothetical protein
VEQGQCSDIPRIVIFTTLNDTIRFISRATAPAWTSLQVSHKINIRSVRRFLNMFRFVRTLAMSAIPISRFGVLSLHNIGHIGNASIQSLLSAEGSINR